MPQQRGYRRAHLHLPDQLQPLPVKQHLQPGASTLCQPLSIQQSTYDFVLTICDTSLAAESCTPGARGTEPKGQEITRAPLLGAPGTLAVPVTRSDSSGLKQHCELGAAGRSPNVAMGALSFRASHTCTRKLIVSNVLLPTEETSKWLTGPKRPYIMYTYLHIYMPTFRVSSPQRDSNVLLSAEKRRQLIAESRSCAPCRLVLAPATYDQSWRGTICAFGTATCAIAADRPTLPEHTAGSGGEVDILMLKHTSAKCSIRSD